MHDESFLKPLRTSQLLDKFDAIDRRLRVIEVKADATLSIASIALVAALYPAIPYVVEWVKKTLAH